MTPKLQIKKDPYLLAFAAILIIAAEVLVGFDKVSFKEAAAFIGGALALPGLFGAASSDDDSTPPAPGAAALLALVAGASLIVGCPRPLTPEEKQKAAEGSYGAELQTCVQQSKTAAQADECAADVRARWGVK